MLSFPHSWLVDFPETELEEGENNQQVEEGWVRDYLHCLNTYKTEELWRLRLRLLRELANGVKGHLHAFLKSYGEFGENPSNWRKGKYQTCLQKRRGKMIWGTSGQPSLTLLPETIMACIQLEHIPCCMKEKPPVPSTRGESGPRQLVTLCDTVFVDKRRTWNVTLGRLPTPSHKVLESTLEIKVWVGKHLLDWPRWEGVVTGPNLPGGSCYMMSFRIFSGTFSDYYFQWWTWEVIRALCQVCRWHQGCGSEFSFSGASGHPAECWWRVDQWDRDKLFTAILDCMEETTFFFPKIMAKPWGAALRALWSLLFGDCKPGAELLLCAGDE